MIRIVLAFLILFPLAGRTQEWKTFSDSAVSFTAKYPADWVNKIKDGQRVFFTSPGESAADDFLENVNVGVTTSPEYGVKYTINDLLPVIIENLKTAMTEFSLENRLFFKWNESDAAEIVFTGYSKSGEKIKVRIIQWFCFYKNRLYTATYTAKAGADIHTATARKIMKSIVFVH